VHTTRIGDLEEKDFIRDRKKLGTLTLKLPMASGGGAARLLEGHN
jgi:hypothetical protein